MKRRRTWGEWCGVGISKLAVEYHLQSIAEYHNLDYVILRLHSLYGPRQDSLHSNLIAQAIAAV